MRICKVKKRMIIRCGSVSLFGRLIWQLETKYKTMRKILIFALAGMLVALALVSCEKEEEFDESLLIGKWQTGTLFYRYFINGTGYTWDEGDDVTEDEAQNFTWTLVRSELTHIHILEIGGTVPKVYTVTELTATRLRYRDDFGKSYSFTRVTD